MPETTALTALLHQIARNREGLCFCEEDNTITYGTLAASIEACTQRIEVAAVPKGSVVVLRADHGLEGTAWLLALAQTGMIVAPVTQATGDEFTSRCEAAAATWIVDATSHQLTPRPEGTAASPLVADLQQTGDPGLILFSSGTTGRPKAMLHNLETLLAAYRGRKTRSLRMLLFLHFDHIGGLNSLFNLLAMGGTGVVIRDRRPSRVAATMARWGVQLLPATPTFLNLFRVERAWETADLSALKLISFGAEPMPESLLTQLREALPRVRFLQTFGTSETGIAQTGNGPHGSTLLKLDDPQTRYRIVEGELWLCSATRALGYLNASNERFTSDGWFRTGDLCEEIEPGLLRIRGRGSELINVGGEKVTPSEVESVLLEVPEVLDCTVSGEPHALTGQVVVAHVRTSDGVALPSLRATLRSHCRQRLSRHKAPTKFYPLEAPQEYDRLKKPRPATAPAS